VTSSDLRGLVGRKLRFHTGTGEVLMRRLNSSYSKR
jgi:chemotaxis receptor (MCP) glutamine deamidase CheD